MERNNLLFGITLCFTAIVLAITIASCEVHKPQYPRADIECIKAGGYWESPTSSCKTR